MRKCAKDSLTSFTDILSDEIKEAFDKFLVFPKQLMLDQWKKSLDQGHKVKVRDNDGCETSSAD